jgi:hypothetical protein
MDIIEPDQSCMAGWAGHGCGCYAGCQPPCDAASQRLRPGDRYAHARVWYSRRRKGAQSKADTFRAVVSSSSLGQRPVSHQECWVTGRILPMEWRLMMCLAGTRPVSREVLFSICVTVLWSGLYFVQSRHATIF